MFFDDDDVLVTVVSGILSIVFGILLWFIVLSPWYEHEKNHCEPEYFESNYSNDCVEMPIYAFADSSQLNGKLFGNVFAVCGSVSNEEYVKYIAKTEYGLQIQSLRLDLHDVYFIESDDCEPHLEKVSQIKSEDCKCFFCDDLLDMKYIFYLPSGSVVHDYNVDLE